MYIEAKRIFRLGALTVGLLAASAALAQSKLTVWVSGQPSNGLSPLSVTFLAKGSPGSAPNSTSPQYSWDFGDHTVGKGPEISHTYANPGVYRATVVYTRFINLIDLERQEHTTNSVVITVTSPAKLEIKPAALNFSSTSGVSSQPLTIINTGGAPLKWSVRRNLPGWLTVNQSSGSLSPGQATSVQVTVTSSEAGSETNRASILVISREAANNAVAADVILIVPKSSRVIWFAGSGVALVALGAALMVKRRRRPSNAGTITVKPVLDGGVQQVKTSQSITSGVLAVNMCSYQGEIRVRANHKIIDRIKRKDPET